MRNGWRVAGLAGALTVVATTTACGPSDLDRAAASASSAAAAASAAATAAPGTYGAPVDPSLPNPTDVATDAPATATTAPATTRAGASTSAGTGTGAGEDATVVITYSGWVDTPAGVEVGAYVAGLAESGGTCTLTLTGSAGSATAQVSAEPDAASTSCPNLAVPAAQLSSGTWSAVVSYRSPSTSGTSTPVDVVVP